VEQFEGKVAVITGAGSGIGRGMAQACCDAGMRVVLADVDEPALQSTTRELVEAGHAAVAVVTDVSDPDSVEALAQRAIEDHGKVHLLCNNAGIGGTGGRVWEQTLSQWDRILGINLEGVIYGVRSFVPHMLEHGEPAHVVNTASLAGLTTGGDAGYSVTKFGVVALSEVLYVQLKQTGKPVSASVLCPAWVNTHIMDNARKLEGEPEAPEARAMMEWVDEQLSAGLDPRDVAETVLQAVRDDRFYILTHPEWTPQIEARMRAILDGENPKTILPPGAQSLLERLARLQQRD
jgi:NAD(P)-dependent dehydrogenase (short-subunit alcohol dehydrogenase family)